MLNLIITGCAGFIGSTLVDTWLESYPERQVIVIDSFTASYDPAQKRKNLSAALALYGDRLTLLENDIAVNPKELADTLKPLIQGTADIIDAEEWIVVHLAAHAGVRPSTQYPCAYASNNVVGNVSVLEATRQLGIRRIVNVSSSSVYGRRSQVPFAENQSCEHPQSPYAATKAAAELFCENYAILYGMSCLSLRLFTVYGPRQRPDLAIHQFARKILKGEAVHLYGDGSTARDYTFVGDIIDGIMRAIAWLESRPATLPGVHEAINLGSSSPIKLSEMITHLEDCLGRRAKIIYEAIPDEDVLITFADISKAEQMLGYSPKTSFTEGLRQFGEWLSN